MVRSRGLVRLAVASVVLLGTCFAASPGRALDLTRSLPQLRQSAWTQRDGAPTNIIALAQTPDGYLWIGTSSGLFRFDGLRVERFEHRFPGDAVISLAVTASGDLWIGSRGAASRLSRGRLTTFSVPELGQTSEVRNIVTGRGDEVWIAGDKIARFDGRGWQVMESDWGSSELYRKPGGVWGLALARDGVVWSKNLLGLYFLRPGSKRFEKADGYGGAIADFARAPDGRLWTADSVRGRFYALPDLGPAGPAPPPAQVGAPVPPNIIGRISFDRDGALWCANSITGGFFRLRSITGSHADVEAFTPPEGLAVGPPTRAVEDREGDIWFSMPSGLFRLAPANAVTDPTIAIRGTGPQITASKDAVYISDGSPPPAPSTGDRKQKVFAATDGAPRTLLSDAGELTVLNAAGSDGVLIGQRKSLTWLRRGVAMTIPLPVGVGGDLASATPDGNDLWAIFGADGLFHWRGGWTRIVVPGLATTPASRVRVDAQGAIWLFDTDRIRRLEAGRLTDFTAGGGPDIGSVNAFAIMQGRVVLAGDHGVSSFDGRTFHTLSQRQAPFLDVVTGVVADEKGGTWFHTLSGVYRVATRQLEQAFRDPAVRLDAKLFDSRDGLRSVTATQQFGGSAVRGPDGRLWFLNSQDVAWVDPGHFYRNAVPPPVSIRSLTAEGRALDAAKVGKLAAGVSNLQIDYAAISLQNPDRVRFRYRLDGVDRAWVDAGERRQAFYTRLGPGHYSFRVIAANGDGVWNTQGATLAFEIPPTFVQSGWFVLLCAAAAALALWLIYALRIRQVTAAIQSRNEARVAERERIARELHDTLLQGFQGVILRFQAIMEDLPAGPLRRQMDAALGRADEVLASGRDRVRQIRSLSPPSDLGEALTKAAEVEGATARFRLVVEGQPRALRPAVAEELAAIGQEAILNAQRHARAQQIDASLVYDRRGLTLTVADDGGGLDAEVLAAGSRAGRFGLLGMRERADRIEGQFTLLSRPGAGVKVAVFVPGHVAFAEAQRRGGLWRALRRVIGRLPDRGT